jgi:hypothetical protein
MLRRVPGSSACLLQQSESSISSIVGDTLIQRGDSIDTAIDLTQETVPDRDARPRRPSLRTLLNEPLPKLSSKETLLKPGSVHWLRKTALFDADMPQKPTRFVDAGWDNSSDMSEDL